LLEPKEAAILQVGSTRPCSTRSLTERACSGVDLFGVDLLDADLLPACYVALMLDAMVCLLLLHEQRLVERRDKREMFHGKR
jgi:hypothetical protein